MSIIDHQQHSEPILLFSMYLIFLHPMRQPSGPPCRGSAPNARRSSATAHSHLNSTRGRSDQRCSLAEPRFFRRFGPQGCSRQGYMNARHWVEGPEFFSMHAPGSRAEVGH